MAHIIVASRNPVKVEATRRGFVEMFPDVAFTIEGVVIPSGVSDQPLGDNETYQGAWQRAERARQQHPEADYWVGIEGGNIVQEHEMEVMAWVVVLSAERLGKARTAGFYLPPRVVELVRAGHELGEADDMVFGSKNSKHSAGASGLLTDGVMDRLRFYLPTVILALIPFKQPHLYPISYE